MLRRLRSATLDDLLLSVLLVVIGGLAGLTLLFWLSGQVAGRLFGGAWPPMGFVEMGGVMVEALRNPADPTAAWPGPARELLPGPVGFYSVMFGLFLLPAVALIVLAALALRGGRLGRRRVPPAGPAGVDPPPARRLRRGHGWARARDLRRLQVRQGGEPGRLTLGRVDGKPVAAERGQSVIVLGPPGSGKTAGLVIPSMLEWDGPVVVATASAELVAGTAKRRGELGGVWAFDPAGVSSLPRAYWSPLDAAGSWEDAVRAANSLVTASAPLSSDGGAGAGPDAAALLAPLLYAANRSYLGLGELARWLARQERDEVAAVLATAGEPAAGDAFEAVWRLDGAARGEAYAAAQRLIGPWADPRVRRALDPAAAGAAGVAAGGEPGAGDGLGAGHGDGLGEVPPPAALNGAGPVGLNGLRKAAGGGGSSDRFSPAALLDGGVNTLYLLAPSHEPQRFRPLLVALLQEVVSAVYERAADPGGRRLDPPLLVVLDDAAEVAALRSLDVHASTAGGQGVQLLSVFRNVAQVRARYGERADSVITSHRARIVLSGTTDNATLDYLADLLGDERFRPRPVGGPAAGPATAGRAGRRRRARAAPPQRPQTAGPAAALRQPRAAIGLLIYGYLPPAELELRTWFRDRRLRSLTGVSRSPVARSRERRLTPMAGRRPPRSRDVFPDPPLPSGRRDRRRP